MKKRLATVLAMGAILLGSAGVASAASYADIAFVIDQSGSMSDEFTWLANSISTIQSDMAAAGITTNWGLAGYVYNAGTEYGYNAYSDLSSDVNPTIAAANYAKTHLYGSQERGYHAAQWAVSGFNWTGGDYAKVVVLITDEYGDQGSGISESALGTLMTDNDILLNVITYESSPYYAGVNHFLEWDDAVYNQATSYEGLFDLSYLKDDPDTFTEDFTDAKIQEIIHSVPEPGTMLLLGTCLAGLVAARRRKAAN